MPHTVLFLHSSAGGYGADRQLLVLASGLDPARYRPLVVLPEAGLLGRRLGKAGVEVVLSPLAVLRRDLMAGRRLASTLRLRARNARELGDLARERGAAIVHTNTSLVLGGQAVADRAGAAHVLSLREIYHGTGGRLGALLWPVLKQRLLRADALACVSQAVAAQFPGSPRALVLYDAVPRQVTPAPSEEARRALGLEAGVFVAAVIGRISDWKGQDVFARALAEQPLAEIGAVGLVVGEAAQGQEFFRSRLESLRDRLALGARVRLLGFRDDIETVFGAADVIVVSSSYPDPLPNSALEAAAAGLPVVGTLTGGQGEILRDGVTGRLVRPCDPARLAVVLCQSQASGT